MRRNIYGECDKLWRALNNLRRINWRLMWSAHEQKKYTKNAATLKQITDLWMNSTCYPGSRWLHTAVIMRAYYKKPHLLAAAPIRDSDPKKTATRLYSLRPHLRYRHSDYSNLFAADARYIEERITRFEIAWIADDIPDVSEYMKGVVPRLYACILYEMMRADYWYRRELQLPRRLPITCARSVYKISLVDLARDDEQWHRHPNVAMRR